jgi:hypothetical protein
MSVVTISHHPVTATAYLKGLVGISPRVGTVAAVCREALEGQTLPDLPSRSELEMPLNSLSMPVYSRLQVCATQSPCSILDPPASLISLAPILSYQSRLLITLTGGRRWTQVDASHSTFTVYFTTALYHGIARHSQLEGQLNTITCSNARNRTTDY